MFYGKKIDTSYEYRVFDSVLMVIEIILIFNVRLYFLFNLSLFYVRLLCAVVEKFF
jgi:hypothetical protein